MRKSTLARASADCAAIARWEGEGGKALAQEESPHHQVVVESSVEQIENVVFGGGEAGKYIAWELAKQGRPTIVVERALVGGSCPNIACLPSKNVIRSAKVADLVRKAADYGIGTGPVTIGHGGRPTSKTHDGRRVDRDPWNRFAAPGIEFVLGEGRFVSPKTIEINTAEGGIRRVLGERVFLNLGTHAAVPDIPGMTASEPLTHVGALELGHLPPHLLVLGGGYVGVELAQAFRRFGSKVTVVQRGAQLLPREDPDVAEAVQAIFEQDGIEIILGAETHAVEGRSGDGVRLRVRDRRRRAGARRLRLARRSRTHAEHAGDRARTPGFELDAQGVLEGRRPSADDRARCLGDGRMRRQPAIHARGLRRFPCGARQPRRESTWTTRGRLVPYCAFMDPGARARRARRDRRATPRNSTVRVVRLPMTSVLRARAIGETRGFMKALIDANSDHILGFTMLGADAGEVIAVVQTAMLAGLPYTGLRDAILTHPTMAEGLTVLFANVADREVSAQVQAR